MAVKEFMTASDTGKIVLNREIQVSQPQAFGKDFLLGAAAVVVVMSSKNESILRINILEKCKELPVQE